MSYGNDGKHPGCDHSQFERREFSFSLDNDMYLRFQSFNNVADLENAIKEKCPFKIDIGPVYSVDARYQIMMMSYFAAQELMFVRHAGR
ncbi:DNA primase POLA3 [Perilla frutescens var. frutescens]|nr:DNA primase POLA3 [Perilla frutescens var. frutescens]